MEEQYPRAYAETIYLLKRLTKLEYKRIPPKVIEMIEQKADKEYEFKLDENNNLNEKDLLKETRILLAIIYEKYFATEKEKRDKYIEIENKKKEKYDIDVFKSREKKEFNNIDIVQNDNQEMQLTKYKESIWLKIKKFLFKIMNKKS